MEFPDNLMSSQNQPPQKGKVNFLHYCPHNPEQFDREDQNIASEIREIERSFKQKVQDMVDTMLAEEKTTLNIIPKKANIDLKRSIQPKLDKLRRRTEKTVVNILNKRFQNESSKPNEESKGVLPESDEEKYEDYNYYGKSVYDKTVELDFEDDDD